MGGVTFDLKYGRRSVRLKVPDGDVTLLGAVSPAKLAPIADPEAAFREALRNPIGTPPLRDLVGPSDSVCLVVNDATRLANTSSFLPCLLDELRDAGVRRDNIFVVFACGAHRAVTPKEAEEILGAEAAASLRWYSHDARDAGNLKYFGRTTRGTPVYLNSLVASANRRILTGSIVHHFFAGFGGGRKALVPGVAGFDTIQASHAHMMEPGAESGRLEGNPVHEDLLEAARVAGGADFIFNVVLDAEKRVLGVFAGDMELAHRQGCKLVDKAYTAYIPKKADLVIASPGGYPKDINLYQVQKSIDNAARAVRDGGAVVLLAECADGVGSEAYLRWARRYKTLAEMEVALKAGFEIGGHKAYAVSKVTSRVKVFLYSSLEPELVRELGLEPADSPEDAFEKGVREVGRRGPGTPDAYVMPEASITVPKQCIVAALGDSITYGFPYDPRHSWTHVLSEETGVKVVNLGECGDTTRDMLIRLEREVPPTGATHVIIMGGTNDAYCGLGVAEAAANLEACCDRAERLGMVPVLGLPVPTDWDEAEAQLAALRKWAKDFAESRGYDLIDFHEAVLDRSSGKIREGLHVDGTHPSVKGYEAMGKAAVRWLSSVIGLPLPSA